MSYVTLPQLAERPGALELAQIASDAHKPVVDAALMEATLRDTDRTAWTAAQRADADEAAARIQEAANEADARINGFLSQRGYVLPAAPVPGVVTAWARDITRYLLHKDRIQDERIDPIARAYRDAMALLKLTAEGKFSLGIEDPQAPGPDSGSPDFAAPDRVFDADTLSDFR